VRFKAALYEALEETLVEQAGATFVREVLAPTLNHNLERFFDEFGHKQNGAVAVDVGKDDKHILRYIAAEGQYSHLPTIQKLHAYLLIKHCRKAARLDPERATDAIGEVFGVFLRDPRLYQARYELALDAQRILGLYSYHLNGSVGAGSSEQRFLAFLSGATPDYIFCLDFYLRESELAQEDEYLRLQYGFCVPGREFSPLILKTHKHHERLAGLVYSPNALLDFESDLLRALTMDVFTTDRSQFKEEASDKYLDAARRIVDGPRIQVTLEKCKNASLIRRLEDKIARFRREYL